MNGLLRDQLKPQLDDEKRGSYLPLLQLDLEFADCLEHKSQLVLQVGSFRHSTALKRTYQILEYFFLPLRHQGNSRSNALYYRRGDTFLTISSTRSQCGQTCHNIHKSHEESWSDQFENSLFADLAHSNFLLARLPLMELLLTFRATSLLQPLFLS